MYRRTLLPPLAPLALVLTSLLAAPDDAVAGSPRTGALSAEASRAVTQTLARRGLSATITADVFEVRTGRTGVSCRVRVIVAARGVGTSTATVRGRGSVGRSGTVDLTRARRACARAVAEELAITTIAPFVAATREVD